MIWAKIGKANREKPHDTAEFSILPVFKKIM